MADVRIRWSLDVVDRGAGAKLLRQDRSIRSSLEATDRQYRKTATTAASASARQAAASSRVERGVRGEGRAADSSSADFRRYNAAQREALSIGQRLVSQADRVGAAYRRQGREVDQASRRQRLASRAGGIGVRGLTTAGAIGGGLTGGIGGAVGIGATVAATAGIAKAISLGNDYNRTIDAQRVGFTTLLRSQRASADLMAKIQTLAIKSPVLDVRSTGDAARTLLAYGVSLKNVLPLTEAIGNMSAASGKSVQEAMGPAALAIGQIASKGKLQAQEMNQLAQSVGLSRGRIQKALGLTAKQFEDTFKPGGNIKASRALPAILKAMQDQSAGAADRLAKTTQGKLSRAREMIAKGMGLMTRPLYDAVGDVAGKLADVLQNVDFTKVGTVVAKKLKDAIGLGVKGAGIAATIGGGLIAGLRGRDPGGGQGAGGATIRRTAARVEGPGNVADVQQPSKLAQIGAKIGQVARTVGTAAATAGRQLLDAFKPALPFFQNVLLPLLIGVGKGVLISVVGAFKVLVPIIKIAATVLGAIGKVAKPLRPVFEKIGEVIGIVFAGPILKAVAAIGRLGGAFRLIGAAVRIVAAPVRLLTALFGGIIKIGARVIAFIAGKYLGVWVTLGARFLKVVDAVKGLASKGIGAAGRAVAGIAKPFLSLGSRIAGAVRSKLGDITGFFSRVGKAIVDAIIGAIKSAPGRIKDAVVSVVPGPAKKAVGAVLGVFKRRGGRIPSFADGGLVDAMVSPGEALVHGSGMSIVPGPPVAADSVHVRVPAGTAVLTHDGQARVAAGASLGAALASQMPHFRGGGVVPGRYVSTAYGPPWGGIQGGGTTATGVNLHTNPHVYGIAVDPSMIRLGAQVYAKPNPFGRSGPFRAFDTGGAIKGRRIDFYDWRGRRAQSSWGRRAVTISSSSLGATGSGVRGSGDDLTAHVPIVYGKSASRAGLVPDALRQGIDAGTAGLTRSEISRAVRGARGAERNPIIDAIRQAYTASTREVKIPGAGAAGKTPTGVTVPGGTFNPLRKPIARWIVPYLTWAASHGWRGTVTSGYRSAAEQASAAAGFGLSRYGKGGPQGSNHRRTSYPGGAVDVTQAARLSSILGRRPGPHLLKWAGARDPVHFSHPHGGSFRRGGIVGAGRTLNTALTRSKGLSGGSLDALDSVIGVAADARLEALRSGVLRLVRAGGPKRTIQRLQSVLDLIDFEVGRRIGALGAAITTRTAAIERGAGAIDRAMRRAGVDADTGGGIARTGAALGMVEVPGRRANVRDAENALRRARKTGNRDAIKEATDQLAQAQDDLDEALTKRIETSRQLVVTAAQDVTDRIGKAISDGRAQLDRNLRKTGVDASSAAGLAAQAGADTIEVGMRQTVVDNLQHAIATTKDAGAGKQLGDALDQARQDLDEALTVQIERRRDLIRQTAQERVDTSQFGQDVAQGALAGLDVNQRLSRTADTPGGMIEKAQAIQATLLPALTDTKAALDAQVADLTSIGDVGGARSAFVAAQQAATDLSSAMADAADLIRQAATQAAQDVVDTAEHGTTMADLGLQRLELEQRIAGTYDAGGAQRADYINATIIPAIQAQIDALTAQQKTATDQGDPVLARQIAEQIAGKQNDKLQAIVDATQETADNTGDRKVGGTLGFTYGNENLTDSLIASGNGS